MARKKTPNIDFIIGMAEDFVNGGDYIGFVLDFTYYFIQKYDKMCKENEMLADMINYYLFEKAFDIHKNDSEEQLRIIMKKALKELKSDDIDIY
ncbi:MAG: hypothetical protein PHP53_24700 [Prolixibacteraceae bacterium]|nr:hypothetical protein [Prolixibacteraceae bacterium]